MCHGTRLDGFLNLGKQPHSDGFLTKEELTKEEPHFPLEAALCAACGHTQLTFVVNPEFLYGASYVYDPSVTNTFQTHFRELATHIVDAQGIPPGSLAVDIGSNVGLLLAGFKDKGLTVLGVDPAPRLVEIARKNGIDTIHGFFGSEIAHGIVREKGKAHVITATNVFAHIDDLDACVVAIDDLLHEDGILVIEANHMLDIVERMLYDTFYHQHLSYLALQPLHALFERFTMEVFHVERIPSHGGSIRVYVARKGRRTVQPSVAALRALEDAAQIYSLPALRRFATSVEDHRAALMEMLTGIRRDGKTIVGIGAPAKGNTLLNYCRIDGSMLEFVTDRSPLKQGLYTPGTHLPILGDDAFLSLQPDYALILAWNFGPEIMRKLQPYKEKGGAFILPIPTPTIV